MKRLLIAVIALSVFPFSGGQARAESIAKLVLPLEYISQLSEPAPSYWQQPGTPYCAAASAMMIIRSFGVKVPSLAQTFEKGRQGNSTDDPGLDPDGVSYLMRLYGGEGRVRSYKDPGTALHELVGRLNNGSPVVVFGQEGGHAVVAYGYEAIWNGPIIAIYAADPLTGFAGRVSIEAWTGHWHWFKDAFTAPGEKWKGTWTFVSYQDFR